MDIELLQEIPNILIDQIPLLVFVKHLKQFLGSMGYALLELFDLCLTLYD
jgi:hypothetical protein